MEYVTNRPAENKPGGYWEEPLHCREFLDEFAKEKGFNPMEVRSWYSVSLNELRRRKGGQSMHEHYGGMKKAIQRAYPELQFDLWTQGIWFVFLSPV